MTHQPSPQDTGVPGASSETRRGKFTLCVEYPDDVATAPSRFVVLNAAGVVAGSLRRRDPSDDIVGQPFTAVSETTDSELFNACAPFADARIPEFCSDDSVVAHNSACELFLTAGQVRAIKAAMARAEATPC